VPDANDKLTGSRASTGTWSDARDVRALTSAMSRGDEAAVEAFYRRYFDRLYRLARRAARRDEAFCLDVVQESVLRAVRLVRPVEGEAALLAWLRLVVTATAYDLLRSERRRRRREVAVAVAACGAGGVCSYAPADAPAGDPAEVAEATDQLTWLRRELDRMDPQIVRMIELRYRHDWTLARIAARLGLSVGTVDGRLRRALRTLRRRAEDGVDGGENAPADGEQSDNGGR
jgi:RNA polymerase sigma-70 factor (ECF subfamily)